MAEWHLKSKRSPSGRLMKRLRKKRRQDRGLEFLETKVDKRKTKPKKSLGGFRKIKLLAEEKVSIAGKGKTFTSKILSVHENKANPHYVRRNILTKGALIRTEAGLVRVTSRPGQHGVINGILVEKSK
jgi:small subunit ribosomal protein S8e